MSQAKSHFVMTNGREEGSEPVSYVRGTPLKEADVTTAYQVEEFIAECENLEGQTNFVDSVTGKGKAIIYTVYLNNVSNVDEQTVYYTVNLDGYAKPTNDSPFPIEYLRILAQTEVVGEPNTLSNTYYGQCRSKPMYIDTPNEFGDNREPISVDPGNIFRRDEDGNQYIKSFYQSKGNDGYCVNFVDYELHNEIVNDDDHSFFTIPGGKKVRFTFALFFAGDDIDALNVKEPKNSYLLVSLHFGIKDAE
jgi:hypothetical protein